jgi:hypothetical protein
MTRSYIHKRDFLYGAYIKYRVFFARETGQGGSKVTYVGACSFSGKPCFFSGDPPLPGISLGTKFLPHALKEVTVCLLQKYCSEQYHCLNTACKFNTTTSKTFAQLMDLSAKLTRDHWKKLHFEIGLWADFFNVHLEEYRSNPELIIDCVNKVSKLPGGI